MTYALHNTLHTGLQAYKYTVEFRFIRPSVLEGSILTAVNSACSGMTDNAQHAPSTFYVLSCLTVQALM